MLAFTPVTIFEPPKSPRVIGDVATATRCLLDDWPELHLSSSAHQIAVSVCLEALEGDASVENVRGALVAAAEEAGILMDATS